MAMVKLREQKASKGNDLLSPESLHVWNQMKNSKEVNVPLRAVD